MKWPFKKKIETKEISETKANKEPSLLEQLCDEDKALYDVFLDP